MTISMYKASVPIFVQFLMSLSAVLDKAAAYAEAKKVEPAVLLNTRLSPDMFPLVRQVRAATDHAINACGRLAGADMPSFSNTETTIPELKDRIAKTIDFLKIEPFALAQLGVRKPLHSSRAPLARLLGTLVVVCLIDRCTRADSGRIHL